MSTSSEVVETVAPVFERQKHIKFWLAHLRMLPAAYVSMDQSRMTILYFALSGLSVLGELNLISAEEKAGMINFIYSLQVAPDGDNSKSILLLFL